MARTRTSMVGLLLLLLWAAPGTAQAQASPPISAVQGDGQNTAAGAATVPLSSADLARIKKSLENESPLPTVHFDTNLYFYAQTQAQKPITFTDFVGSFDLQNGPVPYAGMTHQDFLNSVRPKDLYSSGGITATDMLQAAAVNLAIREVLTKGLADLRKAKSDAEVKAIQARIDKELAALRGGG